MNVFKFHNKIQAENNGKVNLIDKSKRGYFVTTLDNRAIISEMKNKSERIYYNSLEAVKESKQLKIYASFPTYVIVQHGTDYANAEIQLFFKITKEQQKEFEEKARPLMEWMGDNFDPHVKAIIDYSDAEILQNSMTFRTEDYVGD